MDNSSESRDDVLENKYKILEELGKGKTSTVYLVEHLFLNKQLAVKLFKDKYWENQKRFARAQREAMTCAAIDHKNVVKVFDFGVTEDGAPYIVQEYISGTNLRSLVEKSGPLPLDRALAIFKQIARGLNCLHDNQVLHRDIKSENIVITRDAADKEVVKLIDLGIARLEDKDGAIQSLTQSGSHIGSPYYISPELCHGGETDNRSDIYSFGCVMYEVLSGAPPFRSESTLKTLEMHLKEEPASLASKGIPDALDRMILKCLAKEKEDRYSDCKQILEELDRISGKGESTKSGSRRKVRRKTTFIIAAQSVLIVILPVFTYLILKNQDDNNDKHNSKSNSKSRNKSLDKFEERFAATAEGSMLSRLTIPIRSARAYDRALDLAIKDDAPAEEICSIAEMQCYMLQPFKNWVRINRIAKKIDEPLKEIEAKVEKDPAYARELGSVPLVYYELADCYIEQKRYIEAAEIIERGFKVASKHPDKRLLVPLLKTVKATYLSKTGEYEESLTLIKESEKDLDKTVGPGHFLALRAMLSEAKLQEAAGKFKEALAVIEKALARAEKSPLGVSTTHLLERKAELSAKLKNGKHSKKSTEEAP
ncbi:MAG: serine/threonine-protein kinase [Cyanobacteriota/Melainabacteria group bacterium]